MNNIINMLFDKKNDDEPREKILYKTKPDMFFGCKKAIYGIIILGIVFYISPKIMRFLGEIQIYLISQLKLQLTKYFAIFIFIIILFIIIYIVWQILKWYATEYVLTDTRIIIKSGILYSKKIICHIQKFRT